MSDRDEDLNAANAAQPEKKATENNGETPEGRAPARAPYAERWERQGRRSYNDRPYKERAKGPDGPRDERRPFRGPRDDREGGSFRDRDSRPPRGPREEREGGSFRERDSRPPRGPRDNGAPRPQSGPGRDERRPFRPSQRQQDIALIHELDEEILRLIMRRAGLLQKIRHRGRLNPDTEKNLRLSWEQTAGHLSRDSRLARDMFSIIQSVEPLSKAQEEQAFYNLAPLRKAVEIDLPAPADPLEARCWLALAAASGQESLLRSVALTDSFIDALKTLNQLGGQLWWEEDGSVVCRKGNGLISGMDKVVHVGDDEFALWLVLALCLGKPGRLKISGGQDLRFLNLAPLRHFLPSLGARLTNVIPAQDGLPVRVEFSGMLPDIVELPEDLPDGFVAALALATPFRDKGQSLTLPARLADGNPTLQKVAEVLTQAGLKVHYGDGTFRVDSGELAIPAEACLHLDLPLAFAVLLLPALAGGEAKLAGHMPDGLQAQLAEEMLACSGLAYERSEGGVKSSRVESGLLRAPSAELLEKILSAAPELLPLALILSAAVARTGKEALLPTTEALAEEQRTVLDGFLAQLGLEAAEGGKLRLKSAEEQSYQPWLSPDPMWGLGLALGAFMRPNLRLVNPGVMVRRFPRFWNFYNTLPHPDLNRKQVTEPQDDKPARRRIIARGVFGELPPEPPAGDDF